MKRTLLKTCRAPLLAGLATLWVSAPVWGDDTEIFFGNFDGGGALPNVLFVMDTSGSMRSRPNADNPNAKINIVKDALKQLAGELNGVNVGLMRFSNPGGPVLYPVTYIDKEIAPFGEGVQTVVHPVARGDDDATEVESTGSVSLDRPESVIGTGEDSTTVNFRIQNTRDDADEGGVFGSFLDFFTGDDRIGVRFRGAELPVGAIISDARLTMTVGNRNSGDLSVQVRGDNPPAVNFNSQSINSSTRSDLTSASVIWDMTNASGGTPSNGETITSPNIAAVFQEITADPNWLDGGSANNDPTFILDVVSRSPSGAERGFVSYDNQSDATSLSVTYSPVGGSTSRYLTGVRFREVNIPRNATITSASIDLVPTNSLAGSVLVDVGLENATNPSEFTTGSGNLSGRLSGASSSQQTVSDWTIGELQSIDVTSLIAGKTGASGWCAGRDMSFVLATSSTDRLNFNSFDGDPALAPVLRVSYDADSIVPGNTCIEGTASMRVASSADDVESFNSSGTSVTSTRSYISIESDDWAALRFTNFPMPSDARISDARLYFTSYGGYTSSASLSISIENTADSEPLNNSDGLTSRSWSGNVGWNVSNWSDRREYRSPDLTNLLNTVLGAGFVSGNAITVRVDANSGQAVPSTYDRNPIYAARLEVTYESDGGDSFNTARTEFIRAVDSLSAEGFTPIQDTMFEAYNYYAGNPVIWGKYRGGHDPNGNRINVANEGVDAEPFWYTRVSVQDSITPESWGGVVRPNGCTESNLSSTSCDDYNGPGQPEGEYLAGNPVYRTPIDNQCQFESHIVFLTDGAANQPHSESLIQSAIGSASCPSSTNSSQRCVVELSDYMYNNDMNSSLEGDQRVVTHMVGFDFDEQWLEDIATAGGGVYATADSLESLVEQFKAIIAEVLKTDTSFVAPVAAINQFNRLTNLNSVYFAVFKPDGVPAWAGNLKKYTLGTLGSETNVLLDVTGARAVDPDTGFFSSSAQSFWSASADGTEVKAGGAASLLPGYTTRNVYTDAEAAPTTLSNAGNALSTANSNVTAAMLGVPSGERDELINWIRGQDTADEDADGTTSEDRFAINDPLHSRPVAVTYGSTTDGDGNVVADVTVFFGSNGGNLHAINAATGVEEFTYVPRELLELQQDLRANDGGSGHYYGLDGSAAVWTVNNGSGNISAAEGDRVILFIGQRRGGNNYYAIDVTTRTAPRLLWKIQGGSGDFADLGQTWARPIPGRLRIDGVDRDVLYITGGYDTVNDEEATRNTTADSTGNAIYIVDALTGDKIWSVGASASHDLQFSEMIHAIPANATVYDVNSDGYDDGMFIGDLGGNVWRFDFRQGQPVATLATGGIIARLGLGGDSDPAENRRFYHSPDVALADMNGAKRLIVTIGSGSRPSPLSETVNDRFYAIFQDAVFGPPTSYVAVYEGDDPGTAATEVSGFYDATDNLLQTGTDSQVALATSELAAASGWYIDLTRSGEKVLSTPLSVRGSVTFTTYEPTNEAGSCTPKAGTSRVYVMSLEDATATEQWGDVTPSPSDPPERSYTLDTPSIVEEPVIICTEEGCELFVGPEQPPVDLLEGGQIIRTYWRQDQ